MFRLTHEIVFNFYLDIVIELLRDNRVARVFSMSYIEFIHT